MNDERKTWRSAKVVVAGTLGAGGGVVDTGLYCVIVFKAWLTLCPVR